MTWVLIDDKYYRKKLRDLESELVLVEAKVEAIKNEIHLTKLDLEKLIGQEGGTDDS
jgi:multidrug resistance efflux pump